MEDEEPQTVETFSYDDGDGNNDDIDDDDDNDDGSDYMSDEDGDERNGDNAVGGSKDDDKPFWKEHFWAISIAFVAATVSHFYNQSILGGASGSNGPSSAPTMFPYLPPLDNSVDSHDHLENFERTSDIYFCQEPPAVHPSNSNLKVMDFFISRHLFPTLEAFYMDDETKEDTVPTPAVIPNSEYQCLLQQNLNRPEGEKLKGWTYVYQNPTLEDMYAEKEDDESLESLPTSRSNGGGGINQVSTQRKRKLQQPHLSFTGFAAKFVNLSAKPVLLYWDGKGGHENSRRLVGQIEPFESIGTATMPGQSFHVTSMVDKSTALQRWVLTADTALVYFEPNTPEEMYGSGLKYDPSAYAKYQKQLLNREFARDYTISSGRTWLGNFPRQFPTFHLHPALYIGQKYPVGDGLSLRVESVTPRVFVIDNFLTKEECQEIIAQGKQHGMTLSTLHSSSDGRAKQMTDTATRSSTNTWLTRDFSSVTEKVYERAAMVTKIDPNLMQKFHETSASHHSIAESLQVVRYKKGEEYTPHHDFVYPHVSDRYQGTRFVTLLIYLNTVEGGETRFPRAVNDHNAQGVEITPTVGKAVLFYNVLPDGNYDDLSQHGSNPVLKGEKWLCNLWMWDPVIG